MSRAPGRSAVIKRRDDHCGCIWLANLHSHVRERVIKRIRRKIREVERSFDPGKDLPRGRKMNAANDDQQRDLRVRERETEFQNRHSSMFILLENMHSSRTNFDDKQLHRELS